MTKRNAARTLGTAAISLLLAATTMVGAQSIEDLTNPAPGDWPTYGRDLEMTRFSPLDLINRDNVDQLRIVGTRDLGLGGKAQFSPVEYDGVLYIGGADTVLALDATNGQLIWSHKVELDPNGQGTTMRGGVVVYNGNVFATLEDGRVIALDRETGEEVWSTQVGVIDMTEGFTAQPIFADGKIVVGPVGGDSGGVNGRVVALNSEDGSIAWQFNIIPTPGEPGFETWDPPTAAQWGGGSAWAPGAYDYVNRLVIYGTGNPTPLFRPGFRSGDNLYTASYIALHVDTGELAWYYQVIPSEEWDADMQTTPVVMDINIQDQDRRVALLPTTTGWFVMLDAASGEFIDAYNIFEQQTGMSPTVLTGFEEDGTPIIDDSMRITDPSESVLYCAFRWASFEGAAFSPQANLYYRPTTLDCQDMSVQPLPDDWEPGQSAAPKVRKPHPDMFDYYGALTAVDPSTGEISWQFTTPYDQHTGPVATAGDLVFAGFPDRTFRAFDAENGDVLWEQILPARFAGEPITYEVDGQQYVAVINGGTGTSNTGTMTGAAPQVSSATTIVFIFAVP